MSGISGTDEAPSHLLPVCGQHNPAGQSHGTRASLDYLRSIDASGHTFYNNAGNVTGLLTAIAVVVYLSTDTTDIWQYLVVRHFMYAYVATAIVFSVKLLLRWSRSQ